MSQSHTEFFGPDLGRGPFTAQRTETAVIQIATALAQARAPLTRSDSDLQAHVDFVRDLADRLAPDFATSISSAVGDESGNQIDTSIRTALGAYSLLHCWLADSTGGGLTGTAPTSVTWNTGTVIETLTTDKHFMMLTPSTGVLNVTVDYAGTKTWHWATARHGRVFYSSALSFS